MGSQPVEEMLSTPEEEKAVRYNVVLGQTVVQDLVDHS